MVRDAALTELGQEQAQRLRVEMDGGPDPRSRSSGRLSARSRPRCVPLAKAQRSAWSLIRILNNFR